MRSNSSSSFAVRIVPDVGSLVPLAKEAGVVGSGKARAKFNRPSVDVITARALAPLPRLLELAAPYFSDHTVGLFLKGREAQAEVDATHARWEFAVALHPSETDPEGRIVEVRALKAKTEDHSR